MPVSLKSGDRVGAYTIEERISDGAFAVAYKAKRGDETVFLKQYKNPVPKYPPGPAWFDYQREIFRRIRSSPAADLVYRDLEFLEFPLPSPAYYQAFEWLNVGDGLAIRQTSSAGVGKQQALRRMFTRQLFVCILAGTAAGGDFTIVQKVESGTNTGQMTKKSWLRRGRAFAS